MAQVWREDNRPPRHPLDGPLDTTMDDDNFRMVAQAKIRAGFILTDEEVIRLLSCELPPEREEALEQIAGSMERAVREQRRREGQQWLLVGVLAAVLLAMLLLLSAVQS